MQNQDFLHVKLGSLELNNPVIPASGTFGLELTHLVNPNLLGAVVTRSVTLSPRFGSSSPRLLETASGLLSATEIQSDGVEHFIKNELPFWTRYAVPLIVNIAGGSAEELVQVGTRLREENGISALEVNLSSLHHGSPSVFLEKGAEAIDQLRKKCSLPLIAKLSPFEALDLQAQKFEEAGADILALVDGFPGMSLDVHTGSSKLGDGKGRVSGPAIKPMALEAVWRIRQLVKIPLIGMGGIFGVSDALEFLMAGASAIAVGTATFVNPKAMVEILEGLVEACVREGIPPWNVVNIL